jgi:hypothetical protein
VAVGLGFCIITRKWKCSRRRGDDFSVDKKEILDCEEQIVMDSKLDGRIGGWNGNENLRSRMI